MKQNLNILRAHYNPKDKYINREYKNGQISPILCGSRNLLPFQVDVPTRSGGITRFELTNKETGVVYDESSVLSFHKAGYTENYIDTTLSVLLPNSDYSAFGFTIGDPEKIRKVECLIYAVDANYLPTQFRAKVLSAKGGTLLLESEIIVENVPVNNVFKLYFDFGSTYDNSITGYDLYLELKSDGKFSPYGNISAYSGETPRYKTYVVDEFDYPDSDAATDVSCYTKSYEYMGNFDKVVYDGGNLSNFLPNGTYSAELDVNGYTLYFDEFVVMRNIEPKIEFEYWHDSPIYFTEGMFRFEDGYKNKVTFQTDFLEIEPRYNVSKKELLDQDLVMRTTSWMNYNLKVTLTKYMLQAMVGVKHHNNIRLLYGGETHVVDSFLVTVEEWDSYKHYCYCNIELRTNTITTLGNADDSDEYKEAEVLDIDFSNFENNKVDCMQFDVAAERVITNLVANEAYSGEVVIYDDTSTKTLYRDIGGTWFGYASSPYDVIYDKSNEEFYYKDTTLVQDITLTLDSNVGDDYTISGKTFKYATVHVIIDTVGSEPVNELKVAEIDGQQLIDGFTFTHAAVNQIKVRVTGKNCEFGESDWVEV